MKKKLMSLLLVLVMVLGIFPVGAMAAESITVYVTISSKGVLAADKNGAPMGYRPVTVTDRDSDGKLTVYDAYDAAHSQFYTEEFLLNGSGMVGQLWGDHSGSFLTFVNNSGISGDRLDNQAISDGDHLIGAILTDTSYWSDHYSFFDTTAKEVSKGTEFTLTLKGRIGMSWSGTPDPDTALSGLSVGILENGEFSAVDGKTTDSEGRVTLSFDTAGTYYVTAAGSVRSGSSISGKAPIIAPICIVSVTDEKSDAEYVTGDKQALSISYTHGQSLSLPTVGESGQTDIVWHSDTPGVISDTGVVTMPAEDTVVTLTATITCGDESDTKAFPITIPGRLKAAKATLEATSLRPIEFTNATDSGYKYDSAEDDTNILTLAREVVGDPEVSVAVADSFTDRSVIADDGTITYPTDKAKEITLPLTLTFNGQTETAGVTVTVPKHAQTKAEAIAAMKASMSGYMSDPKVLNGNPSLDEVKTTLLLPGGKTSNLYITWASDNESVIKVTGTPSSSSAHPSGGKYTVAITRPNVGERDAAVTLTANFVYKSTSVMCGAGPMPEESECRMTFAVKVPAVTEDEMQAIADNAVADIKVNDKNGVSADPENIKDNLYFPAYEGYTTKWSTDLPITIPPKGYDKAVVTRPTNGIDAVGTITLTLTKGDTVKTKSFAATVPAWTESELQAEQAKLQKIADALTFDEIKNKNSDAAAVTSNLYLRQNAKLDGEQVAFNTYTSASYPYQIVWTITPSGAVTFNNGTGKVTTPARDTQVQLKATISPKVPIAGVNAVEKTITVTVLSAESAEIRSLMDSIAAKYTDSGVAEDAQAPWLAADMAAYLKLFPNTANKLSTDQKQAMTDLAIENLAIAQTPGDAAKYIIALVAMGYDPAQLTTAKLEHLNALKTLTTQSFDDDENNITEAAKSPYTLPYVLIAYQQFGNTCQTQIDKLIAAALETKSGWINTEWGPDSITPMVLALAPYSSKTEVALVLEEAKNAISSTQIENGALSSYGSGSAASTGLGIAAYAALGTDPQTVAITDKHLLDGLMSYAADSKDSFQEPYGGSFNTEQGFRGLIAYYGLKSVSPYHLYSFGDQSLAPAAATESWAENCGVRIITVPAEASVVVKQGDAVQTAFKPGCYDLAAGEYICTATCTGYTTKTETITVMDDDTISGTKTVRITLSPVPSDPGTEQIAVSISVSNPNGGYFRPAQSCAVKSGTTAAEQLLNLGLNVVSNHHSEFGFYVESINGVGEFDFGSGSGWMFKVNGQFPKVSAADYVLKAGDRVEWVYTRNLGTDVGSSYTEPTSESTFGDVSSGDYFYDAVKWAVKTGITKGTSETTFAPHADCTRAQIVTFLWRAAGSPEPAGTAHPFTDTDKTAYYHKALLWAVENGITGGTSATTFSPDAVCTRSQIAVFLYRNAKSPDASGTSPFTDLDEAAYYTDAVLWAAAAGITTGTGATTFSPDAACTRAQIVTFLFRSMAE